MILLPTNRPPTHAGELLRELLEDFGLTQTRLAQLTGMPFPRVNEIINGKRGVTPDTALRLAKLFNTTPDLWLNYQTAWDLWHAAQEYGREIDSKVKTLPGARRAMLVREPDLSWRATTTRARSRHAGSGRRGTRRGGSAGTGVRRGGGEARARRRPES